MGAGLHSPAPAPRKSSEQEIIDAFHKLYYEKQRFAIQWMGHNMLKWPTDLFTYADILHKKRPDVLIETGTHRGGSAQFFADCMNRTGTGCVISIDVDRECARPQHPRIVYMECDSVAAAADVKEYITAIELEIGRPLAVMGSLDSDHARDHVLAELHAYKDIVTPGQYLVVEDTNVNGHPVFPAHGPGPWEAVQEFSDPRFTVDEALARRHLFSMHTWLYKEVPWRY